MHIHLFYTFLQNSSEGMFLCLPKELYILSAFFVIHVQSVCCCCWVLKVILKIGWIVILTILIYLDSPVGVLNTAKFSPKTFLLSRKIELKNLLVLPVNVDTFQIAPTSVRW